MGSNQPPERFSADSAPPASRDAHDAGTGIPPYSARWATSGRLIVVAILLLVIAAVLAAIIG